MIELNVNDKMVWDQARAKLRGFDYPGENTRRAVMNYLPVRDAYLLIRREGNARSARCRRELQTLFTTRQRAIDSVDWIDTNAIDEAVVGTLGVGGRQLGLSGPAATEHAGLHGVPSVRVENACAASGFAVRQAVQAIESGMADVVLAGGVEVMTDMSGDTTKYWLGVSGETEWERLTGTTFSGVYAQMADAYLDSTTPARRPLDGRGQEPSERRKEPESPPGIRLLPRRRRRRTDRRRPARISITAVRLLTAQRSRSSRVRTSSGSTPTTRSGSPGSARPATGSDSSSEQLHFDFCLGNGRRHSLRPCRGWP